MRKIKIFILLQLTMLSFTSHSQASNDNEFMLSSLMNYKNEKSIFHGYLTNTGKGSTSTNAHKEAKVFIESLKKYVKTPGKKIQPPKLPPKGLKTLYSRKIDEINKFGGGITKGEINSEWEYKGRKKDGLYRITKNITEVKMFSKKDINSVTRMDTIATSDSANLLAGFIANAVEFEETKTSTKSVDQDHDPNAVNIYTQKQKFTPKEINPFPTVIGEPVHGNLKSKLTSRSVNKSTGLDSKNSMERDVSFSCIATGEVGVNLNNTTIDSIVLVCVYPYPTAKSVAIFYVSKDYGLPLKRAHYSVVNIPNMSPIATEHLFSAKSIKYP